MELSAGTEKLKEAESFGHPLIIYDGFCSLCGSFLNFVVRRDVKQIFEFNAFQSKKYAELRMKYSALPQLPDSVILIFENKIYYRSDAVLEILNLVGCSSLLIKFIRFLPLRLRDFIYDKVAVNRFKLFTKRDSCFILSREIKNQTSL